MLVSSFAADMPIDPAVQARMEATWPDLLPLLPLAIVIVIPAALLLRLLVRVPQAWMPLAVGLAIGLLAGVR